MEQLKFFGPLIQPEYSNIFQNVLISSPGQLSTGEKKDIGIPRTEAVDGIPATVLCLLPILDRPGLWSIYGVYEQSKGKKFHDSTQETFSSWSQWLWICHLPEHCKKLSHARIFEFLILTQAIEKLPGFTWH